MFRAGKRVYPFAPNGVLRGAARVDSRGRPITAGAKARNRYPVFGAKFWSYPLTLNVKELAAMRDVAWADKPTNNMVSQDILGWNCAQDLASWLEKDLPPEAFVPTFPMTILVLAGLADYWAEIGEFPPHSVAHVLLMVDRVHLGLTPRGEDCVPEHKN